MDSNIGVWDKQPSDNVSDHGEAYDEGLMEDHKCEATTWPRNISN